MLEQGVPLAEEQDADDERADHVLAYAGERAVGTARLLDLGNGQARIGRVAVLPEGRGHGLGVALMEALHERARALGLREVILDAQVQVVKFYDRLGYRAEGEPFAECGIVHQRMRRSLA